MNQKKKATGRKSWPEKLARWNTINTRPAPLAAEVKQKVREELADDMTKLSNLLQRDLSHWMTEHSPQSSQHEAIEAKPFQNDKTTRSDPAI
jgi:hypothetical protein